MELRWTSSRISFALVVAGCASEPEPRVNMDLADGFVACGREVAYVEAFTLEAFERLEQPIPDDLDLTLHVVGREEFDHLGLCVPDASGCTIRDEAWAVGMGSDAHELTHMVLWELASSSLPALEEGIAESLGTPSPYWAEPTPRPPFASYATKSELELTNDQYIGAGLYTAFLIEEFGPQAYLDVYRSLPNGSSIDDVDDVLREHLGTSLEELDARFADPTEARCMNALAFCGHLYGPVLEPPFELEHALGCEEPDVLGYTAEDGSRHPFLRWQVVLPRDGKYWVEAEGAVVGVLRCGSCEERELFAFNGSALMEGRSLDLEAGLYTLEVNDLLDGHDSFRLAIREAD